MSFRPVTLPRQPQTEFSEPKKWWWFTCCVWFTWRNLRKQTEFALPCCHDRQLLTKFLVMSFMPVILRAPQNSLEQTSANRK